MERPPLHVMLREVRESRGEKQADAAQAVGIHQGYLSAVENGKNKPSPTVLSRLAEHYELDKDELAEMLMDTSETLTPLQREWCRALDRRDITTIKRIVAQHVL